MNNENNQFGRPLETLKPVDISMAVIQTEADIVPIESGGLCKSAISMHELVNLTLCNQVEISYNVSDPCVRTVRHYHKQSIIHFT